MRVREYTYRVHETRASELRQVLYIYSRVYNVGLHVQVHSTAATCRTVQAKTVYSMQK